MADQLSPARFSHSASFPELLSGLPCSLVATTYQAGQVCTFGTHEGRLQVALEPFSLAMGVGRAVGRGGKAAGLYARAGVFGAVCVRGAFPHSRDGRFLAGCPLRQSGRN